MNAFKLTECPRDAMQGIERFIDTSQKIKYLNSLLAVGFHAIDCGSFVSPKAVPQLRDTHEVLDHIDIGTTESKLLAIVAGTKGAEEAVEHTAISLLGYPFSISETFQWRNTRQSIAHSFDIVNDIQGLAKRRNKDLVVYLSMAFGNPYQDPYHADLVIESITRLATLDITQFRLADTVGVATEEDVSTLFTNASRALPQLAIGLHLHATPDTQQKKIRAALRSGCTIMDAAIGGFGGCPFASNTLTGNIATESLLEILESDGIAPHLDMHALEAAKTIAHEIFI